MTASALGQHGVELGREHRAVGAGHVARRAPHHGDLGLERREQPDGLERNAARTDDEHVLPKSEMPSRLGAQLVDRDFSGSMRMSPSVRVRACSATGSA